jgi:Ca2+-binding RTX toxin-like protein
MAITNVKKLSELASTSLAAYAYFTGTSDSDLFSMLTTEGKDNGVGMTDVQATHFRDQYKLLAIMPNNFFADPTGFNASLFQDKETGKKVLALRGTEFDKVFQVSPDGLVADALGIGLTGFANFQAVQLYRYVKQLTTAGGQAVQYSDDDVAKIAMMFFAKQIELATVILPEGTAHDVVVWASQQADFSSLFTDLANDKGIGTGAALLQAGDKIDVTGHSLGGHLALLFARMFPQYTDQVVTLNAPTFFGTGDAFLTSIGFQPGSGSNITRLEADGDAVHLIGNVDPGYAISIAQEEFPGVTDKLVGNHSSVNGVDGLNLMALIVKLDPTLINSPMQISGFFRNASSDYKNTYEKTLDALRHMILGESVSDTTVSTGSSDAKRTSLYDNMDALQNSATFQALIGKVTLVAPPTSASEARSDLGLFLSLYYLTPFALKSDGSIAADAQLTIANPDLATQFKDDKLLTPKQIANGEANFSDLWLADRAAMLSWVVKRNAEDSQDTVLDSTAPDAIFRDKNGGANLFGSSLYTTTIRLGSGGDADRRHFTFGGGDADSITGGDKNDHLYGMGGADTLSGGKGNDYLEGGADDDTLNGGEDADQLYGGAGADTLNGDDGADQLYGGAGSDTLKGGKGADQLNGGAANDTLEGGEGNDILNGGDGDDTYVIANGDGNDVITDTDGQGSIKVDNIKLTGGKAVKDTQNLWESADKKTLFTLSDDDQGNKTLIISHSGSRLYVKDWHEGDLGISLGEDDTQAPQASPQTSDHDYINGEGGNIDGLGGNDVLVGGDGAELLMGNTGNDILFGNGGDDTLDGGIGDDWLDGGTGRNLIRGGAGRDIIVGGVLGNGLSLHEKNDDGEWESMSANTENWRKLADSWTWESIVDGQGRHIYYYQDELDSQWKVSNDDDEKFGYLYSHAIETADPPPSNIMFGEAGDDDIRGAAGNDYASGGADDDIVVGFGGDDNLFGNAGNDSIVGGDGSDYLDGGEDDDELKGGYDADVLVGGAGNDELTGDLPLLEGSDAPPSSVDFALMGDDTLDGGSDNDSLWGGGGADFLLGGDDDDELSGDSLGTPIAYNGNDTLDGGAGNDKLWGGGKDDLLYGGAGNDTIEGDSINIADSDNGNDYIEGGEGNDDLIGAGGKDTLYGGVGDDELAGDADNVSANYHGDDYLDGGEGNDTLQGGGGDDTLLGGVGDDLIHGQKGNDSLEGGEGDDDLQGNEGNDRITGGQGVDALRGGEGNDTLTGGSGTDYLDGGEGDDTYIFNAGDSPTNAAGSNEGVSDSGGRNTLQFKGISADSVVVQIANNGQYLVLDYSANDRLLLKFSDADGFLYEFSGGETLSLAQIIGTYNADMLAGSYGNGNSYQLGGYIDDNIDSANGNATLSGGQGYDTITASGGNNTYHYGAGDGIDTLIDSSHADGYAGLNKLVFGPGITPDQISLGLGSLMISIGENSDDAIHIEGFDPNDPLNTNNIAIDTFQFADGTVLSYEQLLQKGFDLSGSFEGEQITGTAVTDRITGAEGDDTLMGGSGDDTYIYTSGDGQDTILDTAGTDRIRLVDLNVDDIEIEKNYRDITIYLADGGSLVLSGMLTPEGSLTEQVIESLEFADGTIWDAQTLINAATFIPPEGQEYYGSEGADIITAGDGDDTVIAGFGNDEVRGGYGNDAIYGMDYWDRSPNGGGEGGWEGGEGEGGGNGDSLSGGDDDTIYGEAGNDTLDGGFRADHDTLVGGTGNDTYILRQGTGADIVIEESGENDRILIKSAEPDQLHVTRNATDLILVLDTGDKLTIQGFFSGDNARIEAIDFDNDGTTWDLATILSKANEASTGNDWLVGTDGDDMLQGLAGNDTLIGGLGNDTYVYADGDGLDVISDIDGNNQIQLGDVAPDDVRATQLGDDLVVLAGSSSSRITVVGWFANPDAQMGVVFDDGTVWSAADLEAAVSTEPTEDMDFLPGTVGDDVLSGLGGDDILLGLDGNDDLIGGTGDDELQGGMGDDVYIYEAGDGSDTVIEAGGLDALQFGADIAPDDVQLMKEGDDLLVTFKDREDTIRIVGGHADADRAIEFIAFNDGTMWDESQISAYTFIKPTTGYDYIQGTDRDDLIDGLGGGDFISGGVGDDTYSFGRDYGSLTLGDGNTSSSGDTLVFKQGITLDDLRITRDYSDLTIEIEGGVGFDQVRIDNYFQGQRIENFVFADGTILTYQDIDRLIEVPLATSGSNTILGTGRDEALDGLAGNDYIDGYDGNDSINGSAGIDTLYGGAGNDTLTGGTNDAVDAQRENSWNYVGYYSYNAAADYLDGGAGDDTYLINAGDGYDQIVDTSGSDRILLGAGLSAESIVISEGGYWHPGTFRIDYGVGAVYVQGNYHSSPIERIESADGKVVLSSEFGNYVVSTISGSAASEVLSGGIGPQNINAGDGNDVVHGGSGRDSIAGDAGDDLLYGDSGDDILSDGEGYNYLSGGVGNDSLDGVGVLDGGAGNDRLRPVFNSTTGITSTVLFGRGDGADAIESYTTNYVVQLKPGVLPQDVIVTGIVLDGFGGQITLALRDGGESLSGIEGATEIRFADGTVWSQADLRALSTVATGTVGNDKLAGSIANDVLNGGEGNDSLAGSSGNDTLIGGTGNDSLDGGAGNDILDGGADHDAMNGGEGDDTLDGGAGYDSLQGNAGRDTYRFGRGYLADSIYEVDFATVGGQETIIEMAAEIAPSDVTLLWGDYTLILDLGGGDSLSLDSWRTKPAGGGTLTVRFADGTEWHDADLLALAPIPQATDAADSLVGDTYSNIIDGGDGDDLIYGWGGADTLLGGNGRDVVYGGEGDDVIDGGDGIDYLQGGAGNDVITAGAENDQLNGENGNDILDGADGDDYLHGGFGNDLLDGGTDNDYLYGEDGNDTLDGGAGDDTLAGGDGADVYRFGFGSGNDRIYYYGNNGPEDVIELGAGIGPNDFLITVSGYDLVITLPGAADSLTLENWQLNTDSARIGRIRFEDGTELNLLARPGGPFVATEGNDNATAAPYDYYLYGLGGNDGLYGGTGDNHIFGGAGDDYLTGGGGTDVLDGGIGNDYYGISGSEEVVFGFDSGQDVIQPLNPYYPQAPKVVRFESNVQPSDVLISTLSITAETGLYYPQERFSGQLTISLKGSDATLYGLVVGRDTVTGGATVPTTFVFADGTIWSGADILSHLSAAPVTSYSNALTGGVGADNLTGLAEAEVLIGGAGDDVLDGGAEADTLFGGIGDDTLVGGSENDVLLGGVGNDVLVGNAGNDRLSGGSGSNVYRFGGNWGSDTVYLTSDATETIEFDATVSPYAIQVAISSGQLVFSVAESTNKVTVLSGTPAEVRFADGTVWGVADILDRTRVVTAGADNLSGSALDDHIDGLAGNDKISGGAGNDRLLGNSGDDALMGDAGNDVLDGGIGNDVLAGGSGGDTYVFGLGYGQDVILDTGTGIDTVEMDGIAWLDVTLSRTADALVITINNTSDKLTIYTSGDGAIGVERIRFSDGIVIDPLDGSLRNDVLTMLSGSGMVVVDGVVHDTLALPAGVLPTDVLVSRNGMDLVLTAGQDSLRLSNWFNSAGMPPVLQARFDDGTLWSATELSSRGLESIGNEGADTLMGLKLFANILHGAGGDDRLLGGSEADVLDGSAGNDVLDGQFGDDMMSGGTGDDIYYVDSAGDVVVEVAGEGNDTIRSAISYTLGENQENLELLGGAITNATGNGSDNKLVGNAAVNVLTGGAGNDFLDGGAGADTMVGGTGNDIYFVDNASDTVVENIGEGVDTVNSAITYTLSTNLENLTLIGTAAINGIGNASDNYLTGNIAANTLTGNAGNDTLDGGAGNDTLAGGIGDDTYYVDAATDVVTEAASEGIDTVVATVSVTLATNVENLTLAGEAPINGTGNMLANRLVGNDAANILAGGTGDDTLEGGTGNDLLQGGQGSDAYVFVAGSGLDTIVEASDSTGAIDQIFMAAGITAADMILRWRGNDLVVSRSGSADRITVQGFKLAGGEIEEIRFIDGTVMSYAQIVANANAAAEDVAPVVTAPLTDSTAFAGQTYELVFASDVFTDVDVGDTLAYSAIQADGTVLPSWLKFDPATRRFSGLPTSGDIGVYSVRVTASDSGNLTASDTFTLSVGHANDTSPMLQTPALDVNAVQHQLVDFILPTNMFFDADPEDVLTLSARLGTGQVLPSWLKFDSASQRFTGVPSTEAVGDLTIAVTATDSRGRNATDTFKLSIADINDAPLVTQPLPDQVLNQGDVVSVQLPVGMFIDPEGNALSISVAQANGDPLPDWLTYDAATGLISGEAVTVAVGITSIRVSATDSSGLSVSDIFNIAVADINDAPIVVNSIPDLVASETQNFRYTIPGNTFIDPDRGDTLVYSMEVLSAPDHAKTSFTFNPTTKEIKGAVNGVDKPLGYWDVGTWTFKVTASDKLGVQVSDNFNLTVNPAAINHAPIIAKTSTPWLEVSPSASVTKIIQAASEIVVPVTLLTPGEISAGGTGYKFLDLDASDTLTYSVTPISSIDSGWNFDATTGSLHFNYTGTERSTAWRVTATDTGNLTVSYNLNIMVNSSPVATSLPDLVINEDEISTFTLPAGTFIDPDGDALSILSTNLNEFTGSGSRIWTSFNSQNQTYTFTPHDYAVGTYTLTLTANDPYLASEQEFGSSSGQPIGQTTKTMKVTVLNTYDAPRLSTTAIADRSVVENQNVSISTSGAFSEVDPGESLTYSATLLNGAALPPWLSINAATGVLSGIPRTADIGAASIKVVASDRFGASIADTFDLNVILSPSNHVPVITTPVSDQIYRAEQTFNFQLPADTFLDVDPGDSLTYSATLANGQILPSWIQFNATTGIFSGTVPADQLVPTQITVTARDTQGATASDTFSIAVDISNQPPIITSPIAAQVALEDQPYSMVIPAGTFIDPDSSTPLTLSASLADGSLLPAWLTFDVVTKTFSGQPINGDVGAIQVRLTATDSEGGSATDFFQLVVQNTNDAPTISMTIASQAATEDAAFNYVIPANAFADVDVEDSLSYIVTLGNGDPLPSWLSYNATTRTISGTPSNGEVGSLSLAVTATDIAGATASQNFNLTVVNINDVPTVSVSIASQTVAEDVAFSYVIPANAFADIDVGDSLSYAVTLANGNPLPSWLSYNATTRTISGTPSNGEVGSLSLAVTATDIAGATASQNLNLSVVNTNDAPIVTESIATQTALEDSSFIFTIPVNAFTDIDTGDTLTYSVTLGNGDVLPSWLSFDANTRTISGTPTNSDVVNLNLKVTATDNSSASANQSFDVIVANINDAPIVTASIAEQTVLEDSVFTFTIPANTFTDIDAGDTLTYSAILANGDALPNWLSFDATTRTYSGIPTNSEVGLLNLKVTATDVAGATANQTFTLNVENTNDAPTVSVALAEQTSLEDATFSYVIPANAFADVDVGDTLSYDVSLSNGDPLPSWLSYTATTRTISGTPTNNEVGSLSFKVTATDIAGASAKQTFTLNVENTNDAPTLSVALVAQTALEDAAFSYTIPANTFTDVDAGDSLSYTVTLDNGNQLPSWLNFDANTRTISGTPINSDVGSIALKVIATDLAGATVSQNFNLTVENTNDAPTVSVATASQSATEGTTFSYAILADAFADVDVGDTLSYTVTLDNGNPLPSWLSFDINTRTISGMPTNSEVGSIAIKVIATDIAGASASKNFDLTVTNINDAPIVAAAIAAQTALEDSSFTFTIPVNAFTDIDAGDTLTYSATLADGSALPSWLSFDATTRTYSGTPTNSEVGLLNLKVTATDNAGANISQIFNLTVQNTNDAPNIGTILGNPLATEDATFSYTILPDAFADMDVGDNLSYAVTLANGEPLPSWLSYNATTRTLSGTPTNSEVSNLSFKVTATDVAGAAVSQNFNLTVVNTNDAPTVSVAIASQTAIEDAAFSYVIPANAFADVDVGDNLNYTVALDSGDPLPNWLSYNATTKTISGTPTNSEVGTLALKVTATDIAGLSANQTFTFNVENINDTPTVSVAIAAQAAIEDTAFSYQIPVNSFNDADVGDSLSYSVSLVNGNPLPTWLSFDASTRTISGTPTNSDVGSVVLKVTTTDVAGTTASQNFDVIVANTNDAPTLSVAIASQTATEDATFSYVIPANAFADIDVGDNLTYTVTLDSGNVLPSWLSYNATTRTISGTPTNSEVGSLGLRITAMDIAGATASQNFNLTVLNTNDAPTVLVALAAQTTLEDGAFSFVIPANAFADVDVGDTLSYGVSLSNGNPLPSWLSYNATTRTISATPTNNEVGSLSFKVTATDVAGATASQNFNLTVVNTNDAPTVSVALADATVNVSQAFSYVVSANAFTDIDVGDTLNYSATLSDGTALPAWLSFNASTRTFSGTPTTSGTVSVKVTAKDVGNLSASDIFDITITSLNQTINGTANSDTLNGGSGNDIINGNAGNDVLNGYAGNDTLNGGAGCDTMVGGLGDDTYIVDHLSDVVNEAVNAGIDTVNVAIATSNGSYTLTANVENATLTNSVAYCLTGNALDNILTGNAAANTLSGGSGNDTLDGLAGNDTMVGGLGNDTYTIGATGDVVTEATNAGTDTVNVAIATVGGTYTVAANVENAMLTNTVAYSLIGNALANFMKGNAANNSLKDTAGGNDILQGLAGVDTLKDTAGNNLFDGGTGNDTMTGGTGREIFMGGIGNDTITTGTGYDVISFNKGDGADIINASTGADNTISLGGNFAYSDLSLTKSTNDLILKMGASDQITLKNWYLSSPTNKSVINLQVVAEAIQGFTLGGADALRNNKIENFNFTNLVAAFDTAGATANWQLTDARLTTHLKAGSDTAAIGGDLAYQYGKNSNLTGMGSLNAQSVISNANFGQNAQTLNNPTVWQAEVVKLG